MVSQQDGINLSEMTERAAALWSHSDFSSLLKTFFAFLVQDYGTAEVAVLKLSRKGKKVNWRRSVAPTEEYKTFNDDDLTQFMGNITSLPLTMAPYHMGVQEIWADGQRVHFAMLGQPDSAWHCVLWRDVDDFEKVAFLVGQLQYQCRWLGLLDRNQRLLYHDELTGLYNNRYLNMVITDEIRRAQRFDNIFSLLFIDVDNFKSVNDRFGHLAGSRILKEVGAILQDSMREVDCVVRYGGDEFVIVLLGASAGMAQIVGERLRRKVAETPLDTGEKKSIHVTLSIGIASFPKDAQDKESLLRIADQMMYHGKRRGKNQVNRHQQNIQ